MHDPKLITPEARGIHLKASDVLMSNMCHSEMNKFVGITLYSPHYEDKVRARVRVRARVWVRGLGLGLGLEVQCAPPPGEGEG